MVRTRIKIDTFCMKKALERRILLRLINFYNRFIGLIKPLLKQDLFGAVLSLKGAVSKAYKTITTI
jgi:hypothetical protein